MGVGLVGCGGVRWGGVGWNGASQGPLQGAQASTLGRGMGNILPYSKVLVLSLAAPQVVTMQDLKQGLGPSGTASSRKSNSNKYKLKVGTP